MTRSSVLSGLLTAGTAALLIFLSCASSGDRKPVPEFDGSRAFEYLVRQVSFGPRVPGTTASADCRNYLVDFFSNLGGAVDTLPFIHDDKTTGKAVPMCNILVHFTGSSPASGDNYLLAAHYDSRPRAEYDPDTTKRNEAIPGANDGASGVAVLMELGNLLASLKTRVNVDIALLDGEDWGRPGDLDEYFLGAKAMLHQNIKGKYKFAILVDMIGDSDLKVYREEFSNKYSPKVTDLVWKTAAELKENRFIDSVGYGVQDDHLSFMTIDLPSAVIIDFIYPYWHTTHDTPDKCSAESLHAVGRVLSTILYRL
jgi:Peptidase family M28